MVESIMLIYRIIVLQFSVLLNQLLTTLPAAPHPPFKKMKPQLRAHLSHYAFTPFLPLPSFSPGCILAIISSL